jgi:urease accessory protein
MVSAAARVQIDERDDGGWWAALQLGFERRGGRSVCHQRRHVGPLRVQRPFYPEGDEVCHVYVLHPPGGVVGGDELDIVVEVNGTAAALLTTPAAGKFYRSDGRRARQRQGLRVAAGATLEWLPQESIVFAGASAAMTTRVELQGDARFMGWEILCLGRPGAGERFASGTVSQAWEIRRDGRPLFIERAVYDQDGTALDAPWGLAGEPVCGSLVCVGDYAESIDEIRAATVALNITGLFSVTQLAEILICRYLGPHGDEAKSCFVAAWKILRPRFMQRAACAPRIWAT